jgi:hypothetical protein
MVFFAVHALVLLGKLFAVASAVAAVPPADHTFVDRSSTRRYFSAKRPDPAALWGSVALEGVAQLEARAGTGDQAWVLEDGTGKVWLLSLGGHLQAVTVNGSVLVAPSGSRLVGSHEVATLVLAQPTRVLWLQCAARSAACHQMWSATSTAGAVSSAAAVGAELWLGTARGLARSNGAGEAPQLLPITSGEPVLAVAAAGTDSIAAATDQTLWHLNLRAKTPWSHLGVGGVIDSNITALSYFPGGLAIGTAHALHVLDANGVVARFSGLQGLPVAGITSMLSNPLNHSSLYIGTMQGLVDMASGAADSTDIGDTPEWRYYNGDRWLVSSGSGASMSSAVTAMAELRTDASSATIVVATSGGLAEIRVREISLEDKIAHYERMVVPQHDRYGWTAQVPLAKHGDRGSYVLTDGDNDGSNTAYYMASQIFRYKVTNSSEAQAKSWRAFTAMEFLHNVTRPFSKQPGFVARSAVRCGEAHQGPSGGVCHRGEHKGHCAPAANTTCSGCSPPAGSCADFACPGWRNSTECYLGEDAPDSDKCCWTFKSDTSTDETDGHFYGIHLAYDHLAETEQDQLRAAAMICNMASYIVDHGFVYLDPLTGNRTTWGYWSPEILNGVGVGSSQGVGSNGKPNER